MKVEAVQDRNSPRNVKDVQPFLGIVNFYRPFILAFSRIVNSLTQLTKKGLPCQWTTEVKQAFTQLKNGFTTAPVLAYFDPDVPITIETDAADYVSAGLLSQQDKNNVRRPVTFFLKKHWPPECNYEIYDKELLVIIRAFEEWRPELKVALHPIEVLSDHKNLEYFMRTKQLNANKPVGAYTSRGLTAPSRSDQGNKTGKQTPLLGGQETS